MAVEVILPRVDMDMATGQISRWYVDPGAKVEKGQPLFEIETDKAAMEIEAPATGFLREPASTGIPIAVGAPVGWIAAEGEVLAAAEAPAAVLDAAPPSAAVPRAASPVPAGRSSTVADEGQGGLRATPLARRLARERGVDLAALSGTGPRGRIQARDVEGVAKAPAAETRPSVTPAGPPVPQRSEPAPAVALRAPAPVSAPAAPRPAPSGGLNGVWLRTGEGEPLVLVHGFGADLDSWRPFLQGVFGNRPVFAVDLPGHGGSPASGPLDISGIAEQVAITIAAACQGAVHLVGHSLGGAVASLVADSGLVSVRSLFLIAPAGLGPEIDADFIDGFGRAVGEAALAPWMRRLVADGAVVTDALVRATARSRARGDVGGHAAVAAAVFPEGTQAADVIPALARLPIPVRAVIGREDRILPPKQAQRLPGTVAVHRLAGIGHMPHLEARDLVARLLEQHIRSA